MSVKFCSRHATTMLSYVIQQTLWMISVTAQLLAAMGVGLKWMMMAVRLFLFAVLDMWYFIPHLCWYLVSPNIIRRVAYRSSRRTKQKNLQIFLQQVTHLPNTAHEAADGNTAESPSRSHANTDADTVELLASTLNPADGRVTSGLPQPPLTSGLMDDFPEVNGMGSFADTLDYIQRHYSNRAAEAPVAAGEKKNPDWVAGAHGDSDSTTESEDDEDEEDRRNLHNRATLDIYLPVPLDSLFRMMDQEKMMSRRSRLRSKKFPIVISLNGGAWIIGSHFWSFLVARLLAARGYVVFCPDYRNFPQTDMEGMVLDVSDAIRWVLRNAERYNGDLEDVTLIGQSAGAHLTMMSLLSQAQLHAQAAGGGPPPSNMAYNVPRYNPRLSIHRYIGLSGIYNVRGLVTHFHRRGLYRKVLYEMAGGRANLPRYSLNSYFEERRSGETGEVLPNNIFDFFPRRMFFIHGDADCSAPVSESANLAFVMRNAQRDRMLSRIASKERLSMLSGTHLSLSADNSAIVRNGGPPSANATVEMGAAPEVRLPLLSLAERSALSNVASTDLVDIEWLMIPDASHTDPIVEEILLEGRSCCVEFLCDYEVRASGSKRSGKKVLSQPAGSTTVEEDAAVVASVPPPDAILPLCVPYERRPWLMRLATWVCPF